MRFLSLGLVLILLSNTAQASLKYVPMWERCGENACYTFDQAKELVLLDDKLISQEEQLSSYAEIVASILEKDRDVVAENESVKLDNSTLLAEITKLNLQLKAEIEQKNKAIYGSKTDALGWLVAGAILVIGAGAVVAVKLAK